MDSLQRKLDYRADELLSEQVMGDFNPALHRVAKVDDRYVVETKSGDEPQTMLLSPPQVLNEPDVSALGFRLGALLRRKVVLKRLVEEASKDIGRELDRLEAFYGNQMLDFAHVVIPDGKKPRRYTTEEGVQISLRKLPASTEVTNFDELLAWQREHEDVKVTRRKAEFKDLSLDDLDELRDLLSENEKLAMKLKSSIEADMTEIGRLLKAGKEVGGCRLLDDKGDKMSVEVA